MTQTIPLTQGKVALVDDEDYQNISGHRWYAHKHRNTFYARRNSPKVNGRSGVIYMHSVILETPINMETDHINGDGLDNRRDNLRICSCRENQQNRHTKNASKFPGANWDKYKKRWLSRIQVDGVRKFLGYFPNAETASNAYLSACDSLKRLEGDKATCPHRRKANVCGLLEKGEYV